MPRVSGAQSQGGKMSEAAKQLSEEDIAEIEKAFEDGYDEDEDAAFAAADDSDDDSSDDDGNEEPESDDEPGESPASEDDKGSEQGEDAKQEDPLDRMQRMMDTQEQRFQKWMRDMGGRVGSMQANMEKFMRQQTDPNRQSAPAPTKKQIAEAIKDGAKFRELADDFPLWGDAMGEVIARIQEGMSGAVDADAIATLKQDLLASSKETTEATTRSQRELAVIDAYFVDWERNWEDEIKTNAFAAWLSQQAPDIQALADSEKARDAIKVIRSYRDHQKASEKKTQSRRQRQIAAVDPDTAGHRPTTTQKSVEDYFDEGFEEG